MKSERERGFIFLICVTKITKVTLSAIIDFIYRDDPIHWYIISIKVLLLLFMVIARAHSPLTKIALRTMNGSVEVFKNKKLLKVNMKKGNEETLLKGHLFERERERVKFIQ